MKTNRGTFRMLERKQLLQELVHDSYKSKRTLSVLAADGSLAGIVSADDVLRVMAGELDRLAGAFSRGAGREAAERRPLDTA